MASFDYRDGQMIEVPDIVVNESRQIDQDVSRTLVIESGATVTTIGRVSGTIKVKSGAILDARGDVGGTVQIAAGGRAAFHASVGGTLHIEHGGVAAIGRTAVALGTMYVEGELINHGTRGFQVSGTGIVQDLEDSSVQQPDETWDDGTVVYRS